MPKAAKKAAGGGPGTMTKGSVTTTQAPVFGARVAKRTKSGRSGRR